MATLIINGDLTVLPPKVVKALAARSLGVEDIANRCRATKDAIRSTLSDLKAQKVVDHDGRRPRTWRLVQTVEWLQTPTRTVPSGDDWRQRRFTASEDETLWRMDSEGARYGEIGKAINRRPDVVRNRLIVLRAKLKEQEAA